MSTSALFEPVRSWLSSESLHNFISGHQQQIVALQKEATVGNALQVLAEKQILSVPVLDEEGEYLGAFSVGDGLRALMNELESQLGHGWFDRLENIKASELESVGASLCGKKVANVTHPGDLWLKGDSKTTVLTVIKEGFQVLEAKGHHRIFVVDPAKAHSTTVQGNTVVINIKPGTAKPEASGLRPTDIVSQLDVVKLLAERKDKLELVMGKTLEELEIFEGSVFTIHAGKTALEAFHHMAVDHKSCLGIVDDEGRLIGNVSISDLRAVGAGNFALLLSSVAEFSVIVAGKGPSQEEAVKGARVAGAADKNWTEVLKPLPLLSLKPSSTFGQLLETMATQGLHRLYITDDEGKPVSIVTLTDVLREVVKPEPPAHRFQRLPDVLPEDSEEEEEDDESSEESSDEEEEGPTSVAKLFEPARSWLSSESLSNFVSTHHHEIVALQKDASVADALKVLSKFKILSVPVLDEDGEYMGAFSVGDSLRSLMNELEAQLGHGWFDKLDSVSDAQLESVGASLCGKKVANVTHPGDLWLKGDARTSVLTVIKEGFQVLETKGHHRIYVVDPAKAHSTTVHGNTVVINTKPGTAKPEASGLRPTDVVSQLDVVRLLAERKEKLNKVMGRTLEELEIFEGSVFTIHAGKTALEAFHHMAVDHKSCLGIVDDEGRLIGNVSISDLRAVGAGNFALLRRSVAEFVVAVAGKGPSQEEVIKGARVPGAAEGKWTEVLKELPLLSLKPSSTFGQLLETMATQGLHRLYITDDEGKPVSIVTLTDVLREVVKPEPPVHRFQRLPDVLPEDSEEEEDTKEAGAPVDVAKLFEPAREWLSSESLQNFINTHHHEIVALKKETFVGDALKVLAKFKILSVPVLDEDGEYLGAFSVGDALRGLMQELETQLHHGWFERLDHITTTQLESVGAALFGKRVHTITHPGDLWLKGDSKTTVLTVIKEGFQVLEAKGHHRIYVVDPSKGHSTTVHGNTVVINIKPGTAKPEASGLRPTDVVSQLDVVRLLAERKDKLNKVMGRTLEELEIFEGSVFTIHAGKTALEAFHHMAVDHKSCLGIVDDEGRLIGNISISDIRALGGNNLALLNTTVAEFVVVVAGKGPSQEEAVAGARVPGAAEGKWAEVLKPLPLLSLKPSSTFGQLLETMATQGLHRLYITDDEGKPVSIVTLTDVLREIVKPEEPAGRFQRLPDVLPEDSDEEENDEEESK